MKIRVELLCWNEAFLLPFTLAHYAKFADEIIVWDNYSDDGSREIAQQLGATVQMYGHPGRLDDRDFLSIKNSVSSACDWRIVCDMDELLVITREELAEELEKGTTVINTEGFNIYSEELPKESLFEINSGFVDPSFSKKVCYNPKQIETMGFAWGAHHAKPVGRIFYSKRVYQLRHYRCIGGVQGMIDRHAIYAPRLSAFNRSARLSSHYLRTPEQIRQEWEANIRKSKIELCE